MSTDIHPYKPTAGLDPSTAHVLGRLHHTRLVVRALVSARRAVDPDPDDPYRGLYVSDEQVDRLLAGDPTPPATLAPEAVLFLADVERAADAAAVAGAPLRLRALATGFGLDEQDVALLLVALAPDVDARFEKLYGYLNDDVTRKRATVGLALELAGLPTTTGVARARLGPAGALVKGGLVDLDNVDAPLLGRPLRVPDRVIAHLLGDDTPEPILEHLLAEPVEVDIAVEPVAAIARALRGPAPLVHLRDEVGAAALAVAGSALRHACGDVVALDLELLTPGDEPLALVRSAIREARLRGAGLVAGPLDELTRRDPTAARVLASATVPVVVYAAGGWDPAWSAVVPLTLPAPVLTATTRDTVWRAELRGAGDLDDPTAATASFRLTPEQIRRAARSARLHAAADGRPVAVADLRAGARAQNAVGLEQLARRVEPAATWSDLVLPPAQRAGLGELAARGRHRDVVLDEWGMGRRTGQGRGVTALFAGESGTGKTLSAEVVAGDLGLDLYVVDLSTVVDKYIGETEKNLDRVFAQADRVNGVLLFDEADALFGKRSEVSDAHDRHANVEVAYLLQRMEQFDGIAILTTNLRSNIDDAFTRRLDAIVEFTKPDVAERERLWRSNLKARLPLTGDVDVEFLARSFRLVGGEIRNIAVTAAYLAADRGDEVTMLDLVRATAREYRKLGRLCVVGEFGSYLEQVS